MKLNENLNTANKQILGLLILFILMILSVIFKLPKFIFKVLEFVYDHFDKELSGYINTEKQYNRNYKIPK